MSEVENTEDAAPAQVTLSEICQELGLKPQLARVKLRRKLAKESREPGFRWVFPLEDKQKIVDLLTAQPEPKAPTEKKAKKAKKEAAPAVPEVEENEEEFPQE